MTGGVCQIGARCEGELDQSVRQVTFNPGVSLRDILNTSALRVRSACNGLGACGLCRIRIDSGDGGRVTDAERLHLDEATLAEGVRLACQVIPATSLDVTVLCQARPTPWRSPLLTPYRPAYALAPVGGRQRLGIAVDLGTTTITLAACDLGSGRRLAVRSAPNPQLDISSDVVGRLHRAATAPGEGRLLKTLVESAIRDGLRDLSRGEGLPLRFVERLRIVGNTAMLILLAGADPRPLLLPSGWNRPAGQEMAPPAGLAEALELNADTDIALVPALGGFVGSDLALGVVHTRLTDLEPPAMLIDFGTNSEMGLWDGRTLWISAAAGGPAFEGVGIGCGVAAGPGAVQRLRRDENGGWLADTIDNVPPTGLCGSGLIDLLGELRACGDLDAVGRPRVSPLEIPVRDRRFTIGKADLDKLQRAKAAIGAGLETLCRLAEVPVDGLATVLLAGAFGDSLGFANAMRIGLLPALPPERFRMAGNAALAGALDLLLSPAAEDNLAAIRRLARLVNLSMVPHFDEVFMDHLFLRPMGDGGVP
ncbi:MAG: ASKHA domain-containing protein [Actinomycetota bacterium]